MTKPMVRSVYVRFPADRDNDFYFRVFIWADDTLYPRIDMKGIGVIHDLDRVRDTLRIDVRNGQHRKRVLSILKKTMPRHFPGGEGTINLGDPGDG